MRYYRHFSILIILFVLFIAPHALRADAEDEGDSASLRQDTAELTDDALESAAALESSGEETLEDAVSVDDGLFSDRIIQERNPHLMLATLDLASFSSNPRALKEVYRNLNRYTDTMKDNFSRYLTRSGRYMSVMRGILKEKGIPEAIVFLPIVESGFNPYARSPKKAVGPWQFIESTGKRYGLKVDWWVDERRDPIKSTIAAADYLNDLYERFGSWSLAIAAYNAGEGMIQRALKRTKGEDYWDIMHTRHIKRETSNYIPKFIAASLIALDPEGFGFKDLEYEETIAYDEVVLTEPVDLSVIAECADTGVEAIKNLNPELRRDATPPGNEYLLRIPPGTQESFIQKLAAVPEHKRFTLHRDAAFAKWAGAKWVSYTIRKGDTLSGIAHKIGVPQIALFALNPNINPKRLVPGKKIKIPATSERKTDKGKKGRTGKA